MTVKLVTKKAFEKHCSSCPFLSASDEGGPSFAIVCKPKSCPIVQDRAGVIGEDEEYIAFCIGLERIDVLKTRAKMKQTKQRTCMGARI